MMAALFCGNGILRVAEVAVPEISEFDILLKTKSVLVCGTDIRMFRNGRAGISKQFPLILGHELSGIIERVGTAVKRYREGMRITVAPNMGCGICDICVSGNTHLCPDYKALGINLNGGFAEYVRIPREAIVQGNVAILPEDMTFEEAAIAEPLSCAYSAFERAAIRAGDSVLIFGAGPIGIMHAKLAKMAGAAKIMFADPNKDRLDAVKVFDTSFIMLDHLNLATEVVERTHGRGIDVSITACPSPEAQIKAVELAALNGRVILFGGLAADKACVPLSANIIHYRQVNVTGTCRSSPAQFRKTIELMSDGLIDVKSLITGRFNLEHIGKAFNQAERGIGMKNAVNFPQEEKSLPMKTVIEAIGNACHQAKPKGLTPVPMCGLMNGKNEANRSTAGTAQIPFKD
jgi:L-iditol 2-dehydrogenase